ncbi:3-keto-disaccharide hydrolase [Coraliomargarita sinensis]|uniref:3-keto-disaccharide hydrolase n=1 Tax=Coraliomargarita sinensis TaxID=2174842 RepID=UPI0018EEB02F|nr:DUF1080 domain-containing protein [Coraliomargarita sinensis]
MIKILRPLILISLAFILVGCFKSSFEAKQGKWIPLFNGKDLTGWTPKFAGHTLGYNLNNIFRVEDGLLKVSYEDTEEFKGDFGHLFYETPYSHYRIRAVFRFTGEQLPGGPGWAYRNNGLMLHSQDPITMGLDQKFPASIEVQFKGNKFVDGQPTDNKTMGALFNPGTTARVNGEKVVQAQTSSPVFEGTEWCTVEVEVRGQEEMIHYVNGEEVLRSTDFRLDRGAPIGSGFIAIQAETHPTEFKSIELMLLDPPATATKTGTNNKAPEGYTSLFDGETLEGWKVHPKSVGHWKVLDGVIDYDALSEAPGNERHLWTEKSFGDFELHVDWRIKELNGLYPVPIILSDGTYKKDEDGKVITMPTPNADSGVLIRGEMKSQCNIWNWPVGSGEVYGYRMDKSMPAEVRAAVTPSRKADNPIGEWNKYIITMKGDRLTVNLNGQTVIENAKLPGIPQEGPIGFQHHGGKNKDGEYNNSASLVQFRNIFIKEL